MGSNTLRGKNCDAIEYWNKVLQLIQRVHAFVSDCRHILIECNARNNYHRHYSDITRIHAFNQLSDVRNGERMILI